jgi:hypothetical protein
MIKDVTKFAMMTLMIEIKEGRDIIRQIMNYYQIRSKIRE